MDECHVALHNHDLYQATRRFKACRRRAHMHYPASPSSPSPAPNTPPALAPSPHPLNLSKVGVYWVYHGVGLGVRVSHGLVMDFTVCVPMTVAGVRPAHTERR